MTLYLIRHGETDWNRAGRLQGCEDIPLNEAGRAQAREAAGTLLAEGLESIWSSPLSRARESAEIIAARCGTGPVRIHELLKEREFGASGGLTRDQRRERFPDEETIPGQEPFADLQKRALAALEHIAGTDTGTRILVVSHGAFIDSVIRHFSGIPWKGLNSINLKNGSLVRLERTADSFVLVR